MSSAFSEVASLSKCFNSVLSCLAAALATELIASKQKKVKTKHKSFNLITMIILVCARVCVCPCVLPVSHSEPSIFMI